MRRLIVGDIHGCYDKLREVLNISNFSNDDILYSVGDFCDRGNQNLEVLDYLMSLSNFKAVRGNHDIWLYNYLYCGLKEYRLPYEDLRIWEYNGGDTTLEAITNLERDKLQKIFNWLKGWGYYIEEDTFIVLHGGPIGSTIPKDLPEEGYDFTNTIPYNTTWDRAYFSAALSYELSEYSSISPLDFGKTLFVGHTPVLYKKDGVVNTNPIISNTYHIINVDTGGYKKEGKLTVMDIDTKEYWQA